MQPNKASLIGTVCLIVTFIFSNVASAKSPAVVLKPKRNDVVSGVHEIIGKLGIQGTPVVLVRSEDDDKWWVQPKAEIDRRGYFRTRVRFGNERTPAETKFHLVVVVLQKQAHADSLMGLGQISDIPPQVHRSVERVYTFRSQQQAKLADAPQKYLTSIQNGARVGKHVELTGQLPARGHPLVLVRAEEPAGEWWIQPHLQVEKDRTATGFAHVGNDRTAAGTKFRLSLFMLKSERRRNEYQEGNACDKIPDDEFLLESFVVESVGPHPE